MNAEIINPEIGSHFWLESRGAGILKNKNIDWFENYDDGVFVFSGRMAIALALRDIMQKHSINKAYVPSYCCSSMIQPFIDCDIAYEFYDITFDGNAIEYHVDVNKRVDVMLIMNYFGVKGKSYSSIVSAMQSKGCIVIEDITHVLLDEIVHSRKADYCVASIRKWFPIPSGGLVIKRKGKLSTRPEINGDQFISVKLEAMREKYDYLKGKYDEKENYLKKFNLFESSLNTFDILLKIDNVSYHILESIDLERVKERRKENAAVLYNRLHFIKGLKFLDLYYDLKNKIPLFVPIMLPTEKRNKLRSYLIERKIYCPIHWPEVKGAVSGIRKNELSLICDQRYNISDMNFMADVIVEWCNRNLND